QDEVRFPMVATLAAMLGVRGDRLTAETWDCKDLLDVLCVVNLLSAAVHSNMLEFPKDATKKTGQSKTRRLQEVFTKHLRHVGWSYPWDKHKEADEALAKNQHLRRNRHATDCCDRLGIHHRRRPAAQPATHPDRPGRRPFRSAATSWPRCAA